MTPRRANWLDGRVDALLAALSELGLSVSHPAAAELIQERVQWVAKNMRISPASARSYLTDEALASLARTMVVAFADETPGADVLESPRTARLPLAVLGRGVAGLAEALLVRARERDDVAHLREVVGQLAHALSALGQLASDHPADPSSPGDGEAVAVMAPPGRLHRTARYLEAAARVVRDDGVLPEELDPAQAEQLAAAFVRDAAAFRRHADEAGTR